MQSLGVDCLTWGPPDGAPLVAVHSSGVGAEQWLPLRHLLPQRRILAPQLSGYGRTPFDPERPCLPVDLAIVAAAMRAAGGHADLVGHSYGGYLALLHARAHPGTVRRLVLMEPVAFGFIRGDATGPARDELASFDDDDGFYDPATGGGPAWMERFIDYWNGVGAWRRMSERQRQAMLLRGPKVFREVTAAGRDATRPGDLAGLTMPTLLLRGARTTATATRIIDLIAAELPDATVATVAGAGHLFPLTHPGDLGGGAGLWEAGY
ncbi:MAG: alpha/beta hydrolase [bacterium]